MTAFEFLHRFTITSVFLRLVMAMLVGGLLGMNRTQKGRAAGFRTYMLVCMGAALTMILNQYLDEMLLTQWLSEAERAGVRTDLSRLGAQVINGIGFLGAGTIVVTGRQEVQGLTTAAGLWVSACIGLAVGAGFFEGALLAFVVALVAIRLLPLLEAAILEHGRNVEIYVEFTSMEDLGEILVRIRQQNARIYEVDVNRSSESPTGRPSAVFNIRLQEHCPHSKVLAAISEYDRITLIDEV